MKTLVIGLVVISSVFALVSCAGMPDPGETEAVLVIDSRFDNVQSSRVAGQRDYYSFFFDGDVSPAFQLSPHTGLVFVDDLSAGTHQMTGIEWGDSFYDFSGEDIRITLDQGAVTVFPAAFVVTLKQTGGNTYRISFDFEMLSEDRYDEIYEKIAGRSGAENWEPFKSDL